MSSDYNDYTAKDMIDEMLKMIDENFGVVQKCPELEYESALSKQRECQIISFEEYKKRKKVRK